MRPAKWLAGRPDQIWKLRYRIERGMGGRDSTGGGVARPTVRSNRTGGVSPRATTIATRAGDEEFCWLEAAIGACKKQPSAEIRLSNAQLECVATSLAALRHGLTPVIAVATTCGIDSVQACTDCDNRPNTSISNVMRAMKARNADFFMTLSISRSVDLDKMQICSNPGNSIHCSSVIPP